ncbi:hypothetical protein [Mucilaginibacter auburnensis]|uniref:Uncharacterized protein n=1 Tax=Mucilaginibacter auburnensis TaxID=1457233 RepID=A0A2H9VW27_9SPHI|nr:hypothetical protein [Mucilaginibacter auburnensis]PJJ85033.1 hypothetical protein CLV57_2056 [Mucilaginibacter auburnensis]
MKNKSAFTKSESARLRNALEQQLNSLIFDSEYGYYIEAYTKFGWRVLAQRTLNLPSPSVKNAYQIWLSMCVSDRYLVLIKFRELTDRFPPMSTNIRVLLFCRVFMTELAPILIRTSAYSD